LSPQSVQQLNSIASTVTASAQCAILLEHVGQSISKSTHDKQHFFFQQHIPIMKTIDFDAKFNNEQFQTPKFQNGNTLTPSVTWRS